MTAMERPNYQQRLVDVLKAVAVSRTTITAGNLAWAINYQRVTRPLSDLLLSMRPILEDNGWPPLTCLVLQTERRALLPVDQVADLRIQQRQCWAWALESSLDCQQLHGQLADLALGGDSA